MDIIKIHIESGTSDATGSLCSGCSTSMTLEYHRGRRHRPAGHAHEMTQWVGRDSPSVNVRVGAPLVEVVTAILEGERAVDV